MNRKLLALAVALATTAVLAACGSGGSTNSSGRTIDVDMRDINFSPSNMTVKSGEQVKFVFHNNGAIAHDAYIGDDAAQMMHDSEMSQQSQMMSGMDHGGGHGTDGITVEPGMTGTLTHTFTAPGTTVIGCHQQGHYAAGMKIGVTVT